jgi:hypothetical protein
VGIKVGILVGVGVGVTDPTVTVDDAMVPMPWLPSTNVPLMVCPAAVVGARRVYVKGLTVILTNLCVPDAVMLVPSAVVLIIVNPEGIVSSIPHGPGRFELGVIVTTIVAPGATVAADKDLVTLPTLDAAIACTAKIASTASTAKERDEIYFIVFILFTSF